MLEIVGQGSLGPDASSFPTSRISQRKTLERRNVKPLGKGSIGTNELGLFPYISFLGRSLARLQKVTRETRQEQSGVNVQSLP